jgi:hypothetical protein
MALVFEDTDIDKSVEDSIAQSKYDSILRKEFIPCYEAKGRDIDGTIFHPNTRHYLEGVRCNAQGEIGYYNGFKLGPLPIVEIIEELIDEKGNFKFKLIPNGSSIMIICNNKIKSLKNLPNRVTSLNIRGTYNLKKIDNEIEVCKLSLISKRIKTTEGISFRGISECLVSQCKDLRKLYLNTDNHVMEELTLEHTNELSIVESNVQYISKMYLKNIDIKTIRPLLDSLLKVDRLHLQQYSFLNYKFSDVNQFIELIKKCSSVAMERKFYTGEEFLKEYGANIKKFCVRNPKRK